QANTMYRPSFHDALPISHVSCRTATLCDVDGDCARLSACGRADLDRSVARLTASDRPWQRWRGASDALEASARRNGLGTRARRRSEEHTSELQSRFDIV